jgi:hypothetical protein
MAIVVPDPPGSDAPLPLPAICVAAFKLQAEQQAIWERDAGRVWHDNGPVITTHKGTPYEPRNFTRHFASRCAAAGSATPFGHLGRDAPRPASPSDAAR